MSVKRRPDTDINQDNWNDEDEPEQEGTFEKATEEELKARVIKTAKRRIKPGDSNGDQPKANAFSSFAGFGASKNGDSAKSTPLFSFGKKPEEPAASKPNAFCANYNLKTQPTTMATSDVEKTAEFCSNLKGLNSAFVKCIQTHVDGTKPCILTPILNDYIKFVQELETNASKPAISAAPAPVGTGLFGGFGQAKPNLFGSIGSVQFPSKPADINGFGSSTDKPSFFASSAPSSSTAPPSSEVSQTNKKKALFSFLNIYNYFYIISFVFQGGSENKDEQDEDSPPKVEFTPVVESESIYSIRCKVFVKKDNDYASRGTGTLYLKSVAKGRVQMIVRADTNLGNILVNILLSTDLPAKRLGKNNVMMVCILTPDDPKPVPILLRVKNEQEADKLCDEITKNSK